MLFSIQICKVSLCFLLPMQITKRIQNNHWFFFYVMYIRRHTCVHMYFFSGGKCKPLRIECFYLVKNTSLFTSRVKVKKRCLLGKKFISTWNRLLKNSHLCEMDSLNVSFCNAFVSWMCILRFLLFFSLFNRKQAISLHIASHQWFTSD